MSAQTVSLHWLLASAVLLSSCGHQDKTLNLWEYARSGLYDAAYSDDGRYVVVSALKEGARYWNLIENRALYRWRHDENAENGIKNIDFSPDGSRVITADEHTYVVWDTATGRALGYWAVDADILDVAISNNGNTVLLGLEDGRALHIDQKTRRRLEVIAHGSERVGAVELSANGKLAITGGDDSRAMVWSTVTGKEIASFKHRSRITLLALDRQMKKVFSVDNEAGAYIWNMYNGELIAKLETKPRQYVTSAARFSRDGSLLITGSPAREVSIWGSDSGKRMRSWHACTEGRWPPRGATIQAVAFAEDERSVVATASNGYGHRWAWQP